MIAPPKSPSLPLLIGIRSAMNNSADCGDEEPDSEPAWEYSESAVEVAANAMNPTFRAGDSLKNMKALSSTWQDTCIALEEQVTTIVAGDTSALVKTLAAQAFTLDALFHHSAQMAGGQPNPTWAGLYYQVAIKAQAQCTRTVSAIAKINQLPKVLLIDREESEGGSEAIADQAPATEPKQEPAPNIVRLAENKSTDGEELDAAGTG